MAGNEQISGADRFNDLRKELEGKIEKLDSKIAEKATSSEFRWFNGILVAILLSAVGYFATQIHQINDINLKMAVFDYRINEIDNKVGIKHTP